MENPSRATTKRKTRFQNDLFAGVACLLLVLSSLLTFTVVRSALRKPPAYFPGLLVIERVKDVAEYEELWKTEVSRRWENAIILVCHGGDINGEWYMFPQDGKDPILVKTVAQQLRDEFPLRPIVLLCCNPGHHTLNIPGVYHAMDSVWFVPDKDGWHADEDTRGVVGNIWEFTDDRPALPF